MNKGGRGGNTSTQKISQGRQEFKYSTFISLDPVRATCLRYAKTFQKVEHATGNRAFFQFDGQGITLKAQDKSALSMAQKQFSIMSKANVIEVLTTVGFEEEELKLLMQDQIRSQLKYRKVFVQLITMEAFKAMAQQLKSFGYDEPLKLWEKYSKLHQKFAFLVCHEAQFQAVREEMILLLKNSPKLKIKKDISLNDKQNQNCLQNNKTLKQNSFSYKTLLQEEGPQKNILLNLDDDSFQNRKQEEKVEEFIQNKEIINVNEQEKSSCLKVNEWQQGRQEFQDGLGQQEFLNNDEFEISVSTLQLKTPHNKDMSHYHHHKYSYSSFDSIHEGYTEAVFQAHEGISTKEGESSQEESEKEKPQDIIAYKKKAQQVEQESFIDKQEILQYNKENLQLIEGDDDNYSSDLRINSNFDEKSVEDEGWNGQWEQERENEEFENLNQMNKEEKLDNFKNLLAAQKKLMLSHDSSANTISQNTTSDSQGIANPNILDVSVLQEQGQHSLLHSNQTPPLQQQQQKYPRMLAVVTGSILEKEAVAKELSEVRWEAVVVDACAFAWLFQSGRIKQQEKKVRVIREDRHVAVVEGVSSELIELIIGMKVTVLYLQSDNLKATRKWLDEEIIESEKNKNSRQQEQLQQDNSKIIAELMSFEDMKEQSKKFKNKALQRVCSCTYRSIIGQKDRQTGCLLLHNSQLYIRANSPLRSFMPYYSPLVSEREVLINCEKNVEIDRIRLNSQCEEVNSLDSAISTNTNSISSLLSLSQQQSEDQQHEDYKPSKQQQQLLQLFEQSQLLKYQHDFFQSKFMSSCFNKKFSYKDILKSFNQLLKLRQFSFPTNGGAGDCSSSNSSTKQESYEEEEDIAVSRSLSVCREYSNIELSYVNKLSSLSQQQESNNINSNNCSAFIIEYKNQIMCLKQYNKLTPNKVNKIIFALRDNALADNLQLLPIYSISILPQNNNASTNSSANEQENVKEENNYKQLKQLNFSSPHKLLDYSLDSSSNSNSVSSSNQQLQNLQKGQIVFDILIISELKFMNLKQALESKLYINSASNSMTLAISLTTALNNIHSKIIEDTQLIHGNLKPTNVLLDTDLNVTLSDINPDPFTIKGNSAYFAPEIQQRRQRPDARSDMFSLGLLLYEIIHCHSLAKLDRKKLKKLSYDHFPKNLLPLKGVIQKCLSKDASLRPTCNQVLLELMQVNNQL